MKRSLFVLMLIFLALSFLACGGFRDSKTSSPAGFFMDALNHKDNAKNGFDEKTNRVYSVSGYSFQIPYYYFEGAQSENLQIFSTPSEDADALIQIRILPAASLKEEEYDKGKEELTKMLIESVLGDSYSGEAFSSESVSICGLSGEKAIGSCAIKGNSVSLHITHMFDTEHKNIITFVFIQDDSSEIDYSLDAEKVVQSMQIDYSAVKTAYTAAPTKKPTPTPTQKPTPTPKTNKVTYDAFVKIQMGSGLSDVKKILGEECTLSYSSDIMGTKMETYSWDGSGLLSSVSVSFSNGKVSSKSQAGLNPDTKAVSLAQFSKITSGMTYEQVVKIMGCDGYITSEISLLGSVSTTYKWNGSGMLSSASITFEKGKVSSTYQIGLS